MSTTLILGAGVMGTAFCFPLADSGGKVLLVGTHLDDDWIESMKSTGFHPKLGVHLPQGVEPYAFGEIDSAFRHNPLRNPLLLSGTVIAQLVHIGAMYTPWLSDGLRIQPVSLQLWSELLLMAFSVLLAMELNKMMRKRLC